MYSVGTELLVEAVLFVVMLLAGMLGRAAGRRRATARGSPPPGQTAIEGSVLALMGLLIAFSFSGAASRFDERKRQAITEANAIGTAYLRLDLLPDDIRPPVRALMRDFLDSRLETYRRLPDVEAAFKELAHMKEIQAQIWGRVVPAARDKPVPIATVLMPALNEVFDTAAARIATARIMHPPAVIYVMLMVVAVVCAALVGFALGGGASSGWLHLVIFSAVISITIFIIRDLEHPRLGLIRVGDADLLLTELRRDLK